MKQADIEKMSVGEKLQAMEALWDALSDDDIESPEWHHDVLETRLASLDNGTAKFISLDDIKRRNT